MVSTIGFILAYVLLFISIIIHDSDVMDKCKLCEKPCKLFKIVWYITCECTFVSSVIVFICAMVFAGVGW